MRWLGSMAIIVAVLGTGLSAARAADPSQLCGQETARQERLQAIPDRLLHAISLVESGRWDARRQATFAWPWTVTAEGEGRFLPSKADAVAEVRALQARGVRNIDVGCMQVNLQAHPDAFASLDEAFEPATNVAYAARFLVGLYASARNWPTAAAYYHSQTPDLAAAYKSRLMTTWDQTKRQPDARLQLAAAEPLWENRPPLGLLLRREAQPLRPAAPAVDVAAKKAVQLARTQAERAEAKRIADAYRQARLEEYRLRKTQQGRT